MMNKGLKWPHNLLQDMYGGKGFNPNRIMDADAFMQCAEALPEDEKDTIYKVYRDGYSQKQLSLERGCSIHSVRKLIRNAYGHLRSEIEMYADPLLLSYRALKLENEKLRRNLMAAASEYMSRVEHICTVLREADESDPIDVLELPSELHTKLIHNKIITIKHLLVTDISGIITDDEKSCIDNKMKLYCSIHQSDWERAVR